MGEEHLLTYRYDGSFAGFLCCVFESFYSRRPPAAILEYEDPQQLLYPEKWIDTDQQKARRVYASLERRISREAQRLVERGFLCNLDGREMLLYQFICQGYRQGNRAADNIADRAAGALWKAVRNLENESHSLLGFLRFSEYGGALVSVIEPKNRVLPVIKEHFVSRYRKETFLIYDKTHCMALFYHPHEAKIFPLEHFALPEAGGQEEEYRALWRRFYETVAIEGRINPRCQRGHMPLWYRKHMTEHQPPALRGQEGKEGLNPPEKGEFRNLDAEESKTVARAPAGHAIIETITKQQAAQTAGEAHHETTETKNRSRCG